MSDAAALQSEILAQVSAAADEAALEAVRVSALGKKGSVSELMKTLGGMSPDERKVQGPLLNGLRDAVTAAIAARKSGLSDAALDARLANETIDVTLPARPENSGTVHPISQVLEEVTAIFAGLGFAVAEGPDVEYDDYNFNKLNIPPDHPARQMQDAYVTGAGAHHAEHQAAHPHHLAGPHLSRRFRRHPFAHVPPGRSIGDRRWPASGPPEMDD